MADNVFWGVHPALNNNLNQHTPVNPRILMIGDSWFWYPGPAPRRCSPAEAATTWRA